MCARARARGGLAAASDLLARLAAARGFFAALGRPRPRAFRVVAFAAGRAAVGAARALALLLALLLSTLLLLWVPPREGAPRMPSPKEA